MKPIIVIIEDIYAEINKIKNLFSAGYDFYPENQATDNSFINNVRNAIDNNYPNKTQAENDIKNQLKGFSNKIAAFIVDYKLTSTETKKEVITGLKFYQDFISVNYPTKPCMILTHLKKASELNSIIDHIDTVNNRNKLTLRLKELEDTTFQNSVQNFVIQANPILQLIRKIEQKAIRNRIENLNQILCDIKANYTQYKDDIITVLTDFANCTNEIDNSKQNEFIAKCNTVKIQ